MGTEFGQSFVGVLLADVAASEVRHKEQPNQQAKRDLVRTLFAAIDGSAWTYREHVQQIARLTNSLQESEAITLSEMSYNVDKTGKLRRQPKFLSLQASIRLVARIASRIAPEHKIDFANNKWAKFQSAMDVRHRITHPKSATDLNIEEAEIENCSDAFYWFLEETTRSMEAVTKQAERLVQGIAQALDEFKLRKPDAIQEYQEARRKLLDGY